MTQLVRTDYNTCITILQVESRLNEEKKRAEHYLDSSTEVHIVAVVEKELISKHMHTVVEMENSGVVHMLQNERLKDLECMYKLFRRVSDGLQTIKTVMSRYLREVGKALVTNPEITRNPLEYIRNLLDLKGQCDTFLRDSFYSDPLFKHAIHSDFEYFVNLSDRSPEYLSLYIDDCLKNSAKLMSEQELEQELDQIIIIFRFLQVCMYT